METKVFILEICKQGDKEIAILRESGSGKPLKMTDNLASLGSFFYDL